MATPVAADLVDPPRHLFFTGKGGVGKTSVACATALRLADRGKRVLLVSTDPASNLGEVLETPLSSEPREVATNLFALDLDPEAAARAYRERMVGPYRGVLPDAAIRSIEEQLSGACTVEIAAFDEFSKLLGDPAITAGFDHVVFDTAPTGHTLRLLELPAAWTGFFEEAVGGTSCLGPLAGWKAQQALYDASRAALIDPTRTMLVLVSRPERSALMEAARTHRELAALGIGRQHLVLNGLFAATDRHDAVAIAIEERARRALDEMPAELAALPRTEVPLVAHALLGLAALRGEPAVEAAPDLLPILPSLSDLLPSLDAPHGVILTMGKGGVGKTSVAVALATELARRGRKVHLTTTDPAANLPASLPDVRITRIDPEVVTAAYRDEVLRTTGAGLDDAARALLAEDLRSPCTEEVAVFRAFAKVVAEGEDELVVIDTAPTGHTLLLLDAAESYHREVLRTRGTAPDEVRKLLPRLRDPAFTRVVLVTLPEATPVHEAETLQRDLERAAIHPFAWVVNRSLAPLTVTDPILVRRRAREARYLAEVQRLSPRVALVPYRGQE